MRRGEICALQSADVDVADAAVTVRASLSDAGNQLARKSTKTDRVRRVPLSPLALDVLRERSSIERQPGDFVFGDGSIPLRPDTLTVTFGRLAQAVGVEGASLHSLRHSTATWLLAAGSDIKSVQSILGHSSAALTLGTYSHAIAEFRRRSSRRFDRNLEAAASARLMASARQ